MNVRVAFFSYSLLSGRENKRREKDEDRCNIIADYQKSVKFEIHQRRRIKKRRKKNDDFV